MSVAMYTANDRTCFTAISRVSIGTSALVTIYQVSTSTPIQTRIGWTFVYICKGILKITAVMSRHCLLYAFSYSSSPNIHKTVPKPYQSDQVRATPFIQARNRQTFVDIWQENIVYHNWTRECCYIQSRICVVMDSTHVQWRKNDQYNDLETSVCISKSHL